MTRMTTALVAVSAGGPVVVAVDVPDPVRVVWVLGALVVAPAVAVALVVGTGDLLLSAVLGVASSLAATVGIATALLYLQIWSPVLLLTCLGVVTIALLLGARARRTGRWVF